VSRLVQIIALGSVWLSCIQTGLAQGTIQYFQPTVPIPLHTDFLTEYYPLDLDGDGNNDFTFGYDFHFIGVRSEDVNRVLLLLSPPPNVGGSVVPLSPGFLIGPDSGTGGLGWAARSSLDPFETLIQCFDTGCAGAFVGQHAYMGVEFQRAGNTYYGWVLLQIASDAAFGAIDSWAWETRSGTPILAGAVPEPSTFALLLISGTALWALRRRSKADTNSDRT
jgi:hypothetical protein